MKRFLIVFLLLLIGAPLAAQPQLDLRLLKRNVPAYYYYQLYFMASCGDSIIYDLKKQQLIYKETIGLIDTDDYQIDRYASPDRNSCYDVALVFDNSSTMSAASLALARDAGIAFIDTMSRDCQYGALLSFADRPAVRSFLTNDRLALQDAFEGMAPSGKRSLYDAMFTGMVELSTNGKQNVRIVLALTSGDDNASGMSAEQLIDRAQFDDTRLFIVGLGSDVPQQLLDSLCSETGGLYYHASTADELPSLYERLAGFFQREFDEHRLVRRTKDIDMKNLMISMRLEACGDSVWVSRLFHYEPVVSVESIAQTSSFTLGQSWPNPLSSSAAAVQFHFTLSTHQPLPLRLQIFDNLGRLLHTVFEREYDPGSHTVTWNSPQLKPGLYFYRLSQGNALTHGRMIVIP